MTEDERRKVVISLTRVVRQMGWEQLIEVEITPEDAELGDFGPELARALVGQVAKLVRDLGAVEMNLLTQTWDVESIAFKPDRQYLKTESGLTPHRFERGLVLDRDAFQARHRTFVTLHKYLVDLESALELG